MIFMIEKVYAVDKYYFALLFQKIYQLTGLQSVWLAHTNICGNERAKQRNQANVGNERGIIGHN